MYLLNILLKDTINLLAYQNLKVSTFFQKILKVPYLR